MSLGNVVVGITGSIAAYKSCELISLLKKRGCEVRVILTRNGSEFITPLTLETLTHAPVALDMFDKHREFDMEHISLAKWADVFIVAPATANIIAKLANGIADDLLSTTLMATKARICVAPAMNTVMYESAANTANMNTLRERGVCFIEPASGLLACGDVGVGRMCEPSEIASKLLSLLGAKQDYSGKAVLVSAGATIEDIDPVRFISNRSTGKMGVRIAEAARDRGARVHLVCSDAAAHICDSRGIEMHIIRSAKDMLNSMLALAPECQAVISAAAPADFTPAEYSTNKIKKQDGGMCLELARTEDILRSLSKLPGARALVGFAAETENTAENARAKLKSKGLDMILANDVTENGCGFAADTNSLLMITQDAELQTGLMSKYELAHVILDALLPIIEHKLC